MEGFPRRLLHLTDFVLGEFWRSSGRDETEWFHWILCILRLLRISRCFSLSSDQLWVTNFSSPVPFYLIWQEMSRKNIFMFIEIKCIWIKNQVSPWKKILLAVMLFTGEDWQQRWNFFYILCQLNYSGKNYQSEAEDLRVVNTLAPRNYRNSDWPMKQIIEEQHVTIY